MRKNLQGVFRFSSFVLALGLILVGMSPGVGLAADGDLESLLVQVGEEYAVSYASPFIEAFGPNQNSALFQDAHIPWHGLTFGIGIKVMASHLNEGDQTFQKVVPGLDLSTIDSNFAPGTTGTAIFSGPTIFGDPNTDGTITLLPDTPANPGDPVYPPVAMGGIPGLVETRLVPLAAPEFSIGGVFGLKAVVRYFPEIDLGDYGKSKYLGYGLQWSPNGLMQTLPLDVMVGFFAQELNVGTLIETSATSFFLAGSKKFGIITAYGGFAAEKADMTVSYTQTDSQRKISFSADAQQESRITLGAKLGFLNFEMAHGKLTTYSAGAMIGF